MGESGAEKLTSYSEMQSQDSLILMYFMADFDSFAVQLCQGFINVLNISDL